MNKRLLLVLVLVFSAAQIFFGCDIGKKDNKNLMMMLAMPQDQSFTRLLLLEGLPRPMAGIF